MFLQIMFLWEEQLKNKDKKIYTTRKEDANVDNSNYNQYK